MLPIWKSFASIQARLLTVFLAITLLTVAIVFAFNQWLRSQLVEAADNGLLTTAVRFADRIDEFNRANEQVFSVGSKLPALEEFLKADDQRRQDSEFREQTRKTLASLQVQPWNEYYVLSQAILDVKGQNILDSASENIGADESQYDYFRTTLLGGSANISAIQYRPDRGGIYYYFAVPLRESTAPNSVIGVLRIQITIASIQNIVTDSARGQPFNVILLDKNSVRIVDLRNKSLLFRSIARYSTEQLAALRVQYAIPPLPDEDVSIPVPDLVDTLDTTYQNRVLSTNTTPNAGSEERVAIVRLKTVPWTLIVARPTAQHYQPVQQQTTGILILAISLTFVALFASYGISRRITKPIRVLTTVAKQVAEGDLYVKAPVTSSDELGTLAKTFNRMTTELELAHTTLEDRVKQRTQELSETNEKLKYEILERQRYEKRALELAVEQERRRILSEFIQNASHEFRTPLSIININSYLVKRILPAESHPLMIKIEEQSRHIESLISKMVLMTDLDSGMPIPLEILEIDELIRTVYTRIESTFAAKKASTRLDLHAPNAWIEGEAELLVIAFSNILENAYKFSGEPADIAIKTVATNETVSIVIQDKGIGIPPELKDRVFERFFRVDEAHSVRGFGLGLPIAKRIVENFSGTIALESEVGKGTTVTIQLPTTKKQPGSEPVADHHPAG